ncbi:MAG: hypothetical protein FWB86_01080 [Treponema sp.]|nr:hypothetical protein [Treponema sp.]MCL2250691.1 hypothetical protein [Treponema sp.]
MKKLLVVIFIVYIGLLVCGSVFAIGERTISLGGAETWISTENRTGITETKDVRPHPVLLLTSVPNGNLLPLKESSLDLSISFNERDTRLFSDSTNRYRVTTHENVSTAGIPYARGGQGAALFGSAGAVTVVPQNSNALFAPGNRIDDFTVEFWMYPLNLENGEKILTWLTPVSGSTQRIQCISSRNRLHWSFINFFASASEIQVTSFINIEFSGNTPVIPKKWSHHLIRFDSQTGMIEYLVDGVSEAIVYATKTGRENIEVYTPIAQEGGFFTLGESFKGFLDEFKIYNECAQRSVMQKFPVYGGRMETRAIDLGNNASSVMKIDVKGGRTSITAASNTSVSGISAQAGTIRSSSVNFVSVINEFRENGNFIFSDDSQLNFYIRAGFNPYSMNASPWIRFTPGEEIFDIGGRYVQIAVDFYPSSDGEVSPYLEGIQVVYRPAEMPLPPRSLIAVAVDGGVNLRWRHSANINTAQADTSGYLIYYSAVRDELFGKDALLGSSPIDAGMTNSIFIDGLKNGTLYYFRVAGYNRITGESINIGEFSAEATARPLSGL